MSLLLAAIIVMGITVPFQVAHAIDESTYAIEVMLYDETVFVEKNYFEPITDDAISRIYDAVISGNFVQSRSMSNV